MAKEEKPKKAAVKKGTAYIVKNTENALGGDCASEKCGVPNPLIKDGMTCVVFNKKKYHASCAHYEGIEFKHPAVQTVKRVD